MPTAPISSSNNSANGTFAGDPFCTRGLREALERLERQIGRVGEIACEKDVEPKPNSNGHAEVSVPQPKEPARDVATEKTSSVATVPVAAIATASPAVDLEAKLASLRASLNAEITEANAMQSAAEQRAESLEKEASAATARADELSRQVAMLQETLRKREAAAPPPADPALHKQITALQAELQLLRKERDTFRLRLEREEGRMEKAGITIEWAEPANKAKPAAKAAKGRRRTAQ